MMLSLMTTSVVEEGALAPVSKPGDLVLGGDLVPASAYEVSRRSLARAPRPPSRVELAAVDREHLAGHRGGQVRGEEQRRPRHLLRRGQPLEVGGGGLLGVDVVVGDPGL